MKISKKIFGLYVLLSLVTASSWAGSHCAPPPPCAPCQGGFGGGGGFGYGYGGGYGYGFGGGMIGPRPLVVGGGAVAFRRAFRLQRRSMRAAAFGFPARSANLNARSQLAFQRGLFRNGVI